jgi:hypothetical protein
MFYPELIGKELGMCWGFREVRSLVPSSGRLMMEDQKRKSKPKGQNSKSRPREANKVSFQVLPNFVIS